ncbi:hypothetical protein COOONC_02684 [Cooperia oncophora]
MSRQKTQKTFAIEIEVSGFLKLTMNDQPGNDVLVPYANQPDFGSEGGGGPIEGKTKGVTPSHFYDAWRQEKIYGSSATVLMMVNIAIFIGTIVLFRAVLNATLYSIFPDYRSH